MWKFGCHLQYTDFGITCNDWGKIWLHSTISEKALHSKWLLRFFSLYVNRILLTKTIRLLVIYLNINVVLSPSLLSFLFLVSYSLYPLSSAPALLLTFPLLFPNNCILKPSDGAKKGKHLHRWGWGQGVGQNLDFRAPEGVKRVFVGWEESPSVSTIIASIHVGRRGVGGVKCGYQISGGLGRHLQKGDSWKDSVATCTGGLIS